MAKHKEDCLRKLSKDTGAKRDAAYEDLVKMLSELVEAKEKYDALHAKLKNYIDDPDDLVQVEELCVKARSDDTLDEIMDLVGVDTLDDLMAALQVFKEYRIVPRYSGKDVTDDCMTTPAFWDCECEENYIHPRNESWCSRCGAKRDDQPDARLNEAKEMLYHKAVEEINGKRNQHK